MPVGDILPELALLSAAAVILLSVVFLPARLQWLAAPMAVAGLLTGFILCARQFGEPAKLTFSGTLALDDMSIWGRLLIILVTANVVLLSLEWLKSDRRHGEYYAVLLFSSLGAMLMAGAADTLQLVMGVLLSSVTGYTLAAYHRQWALSVEAGMKYFLLGALTNTLLMIGVTLLFGAFGSTDYSAMQAQLALQAPGIAATLALALVTVGLAFKLGAVPAHSWMPDVAEGAPAPAAAFLTIVPKIGAAIALVRLLQLFPDVATGWRSLLATLAVATMTLGNLAALWQTDLRRLLGWSSISQSGYALMAVTVVGLDTRAVPALLFFLAGYASANLAAFAVVTRLRGRTALDDYQGLATARPLACTVLVLGLLSLTGIPPLAGFVGKLTLFVTTIDAGYSWLAVVAVINTVVSLFYYLRVIGPMYFETRRRPVAVLGVWSGVGMWLAAMAVVALGLAAEGLLAGLPAGNVLP